jgi:Tol biopolymer transport system component
MNANGSSEHALTKGANTNKAPSWSPTGDRIAFVAKFGTQIPQIWIIPSAGGTPVKFTSAGSGATEPSWSPDGHTIVYAVATSAGLTLWRLDPDNKATPPVELTKPASGNDESPAWSPDGTKIAFDSTRDGTDRIYVMDPDGSNVQAITPPTLAAAWPAWSPDGKQIVFQVTKASDTDLYVMPADGSASPVDITKDPSHPAFDPAWW